MNELGRKSFTSRGQLAFQDTCLGEALGCLSVRAEQLQLSAEGDRQTCGSKNDSLTSPHDPKEEPRSPPRLLLHLPSPFSAHASGACTAAEPATL